jgi:hypothetical protein
MAWRVIEVQDRIRSCVSAYVTRMLTISFASAQAASRQIDFVQCFGTHNNSRSFPAPEISELVF